MSFLLDPHLDLSTSRIETTRCYLIPFSTDKIDIYEITDEFRKVNKDFFVSPFLPNYEQEFEFIQINEESIRLGEVFENFIFEKGTDRFIGCIGLNRPELQRMNIGLWIREDMQGKGFATELYSCLIAWAKKNTKYTFLKHALNPKNAASKALALKFGGILQNETDDKNSLIYHIPI